VLIVIIGRRIAAMVPAALFASILTFLLIHIVPGGPAEAIAGLNANQQTVTALNEQLGLNHPLYYQYVSWLGGVLHGNLGTSLQSDVSVSSELVGRLPVSAELVLGALLISVLVGIPVGTIAAWRAGSRFDSVVSGVSGIGLALPDFFLAIVLIDIFAVSLPVFPKVGFVPLSVSVTGNISHIFLPVITLALGALAVVIRQVRSAVLEQLQAPHIHTARAMGIPGWEILWRYGLRNALPTLFSVYALVLAGLLGATIILEQLFVLPGMGSLLISAVNVRDHPVLEGIALFFVAVVLVANLAADIGALIIDPRRRSR
jgi:peptide/nickel transport system permease protein